MTFNILAHRAVLEAKAWNFADNFGVVCAGIERVLVDEFRKVGLPVHEIETLAAGANTLGVRVAPEARVFGTRTVREPARVATRQRTREFHCFGFLRRFVCVGRP